MSPPMDGMAAPGNLSDERMPENGIVQLTSRNSHGPPRTGTRSGALRSAHQLQPLMLALRYSPEYPLIYAVREKMTRFQGGKSSSGVLVRHPDSRGQLLVRIGKVTVVRRPPQPMVCGGRLTQGQGGRSPSNARRASP
jgi:hypothetical protein